MTPEPDDPRHSCTYHHVVNEECHDRTRGAYGARSSPDSAIIAAAEALKADALHTEDLSHGQLYGPVQAKNPFLPSVIQR